MQANLITTLLLPMVMAIIMFGLGLHLTIKDFTRVAQMPRPVFVGLAAQLLVLPPLAYGLCVLFALPPPLAVGLMLLAASPGGATANVFSYFARGDVALNITLTAINSVLALITLPFIVQWAMQHFLGEQAYVPPPVQKIIEVAAIVIIPVSLGMIVRAKARPVAARLERVIRPLSLVLLLALVAFSVVKESDMLRANAGTIGLVCLLLNLLSLAIGYASARLARIEPRQAIAISFEVGVHNGALAILIALSVLGESAYSIPPAVYSLLMYFTAAALVLWFRRNPPAPQAELATR